MTLLIAGRIYDSPDQYDTKSSTFAVKNGGRYCRNHGIPDLGSSAVHFPAVLLVDDVIYMVGGKRHGASKATSKVGLFRVSLALCTREEIYL